MKNIIFILSALFFTLIFATCKKDPNPGKDDFYFQCKINGQTYIPNSCANCVTCAILGDTTFLLGGNAGFEALGIGIINFTNQPVLATTYILNDNPRKSGDYDNSTLVTDIYKTDGTHSGQLTIITLDKINRIIQGTFYFKAYNSYRNDSVSITEGKFRWKYTIN